jgi:integrase
MRKLTKTDINRLERNPPDKGYALHWDETRGFGVRVTAGLRKDGDPEPRVSYVVQGRINGKELRFTLGTGGSRGHLTVEQARQQAKSILGDMAKGIDPRQAKAAQITLQAVADEYLSRPDKLKDSSKEAIERHIRTTYEDIKDKSITEITEAYCIRRYQEIYTSGLRGNRPEGSPGQANQALAILKALLNFSIRRHKILTVNPCTILRDDWKTLEPRDSYVPVGKLGAVWHHLTTLREQTVARAELSGIDLVKFLFWTGCRLDEALTLTWDNVKISDDLSECWYHLPDPKNRRPIWLPLSSQAVDMLRERPRVRDNPFVFAGKLPRSHISIAPRDLWNAISKIAGLDLSSHDARRTFTNLGIKECKLDPSKVDLIIGHKPTSVLMTHYFDTRRLQWLQPEVQTWANYIDAKAAIARAQASGANVVELRAS